mmetsp:Transcript_83680/g.249752  ORF Transcript_83680/g.249752 Transcript_83680/m.249752 type:complete len:264 (-) Transcript_83680:206-997(-)
MPAQTAAARTRGRRRPATPSSATTSPPSRTCPRTTGTACARGLLSFGRSRRATRPLPCCCSRAPSQARACGSGVWTPRGSIPHSPPPQLDPVVWSEWTPGTGRAGPPCTSPRPRACCRCAACSSATARAPAPPSGGTAVPGHRSTMQPRTATRGSAPTSWRPRTSRTSTKRTPAASRRSTGPPGAATPEPAGSSSGTLASPAWTRRMRSAAPRSIWQLGAGTPRHACPSCAAPASPRCGARTARASPRCTAQRSRVMRRRARR